MYMEMNTNRPEEVTMNPTAADDFAADVQALLDSDRDNEGGCFNTGLGESLAITKAERQAERSARIRAKYPEFFPTKQEG